VDLWCAPGVRISPGRGSRARTPTVRPSRGGGRAGSSSLSPRDNRLASDIRSSAARVRFADARRERP
jgi:hypothetical protein